MAGDDDISDLEQAVIALLRQAHARGEESALARIVEAARGGKAINVPPIGGGPKPPDNYVGPSRRAPKGSLDPLLEDILQASPGLTTNQIEHIVHERDPRIAIKSIYNRLRHCERNNEKFQRQGGKWYLRPPVAPQAAPSPPVPVPVIPPAPPVPVLAPSPVTAAPLIVASTPAPNPSVPPPPYPWGART